MNAILNTILTNIELISTIVAALVALIIAIVQGYKRIKKEWESELVKAASPLIAEAEVKPMSLLSTLVNKPEISPIMPITNIDKENIVIQALKEREPSLLKKLKLKDVVSIGNFVNTAYQGVFKPLIKGLQK